MGGLESAQVMKLNRILTVNMKSVARWNTSMGRTSDYTRNCKGNHVN